jgi:hypothetical protein
MNSTSVRKVHSWHIARSRSSGTGSSSDHGMSVALLHWRCTASSYSIVAFCDQTLPASRMR